MVIEWSLLQKEPIRKDEKHGKAIQSDGNHSAEQRLKGCSVLRSH